MVHRDPDTGKFQAGGGGHAEDPYLNHKVLWQTNGWDFADKHNMDKVDGRDAIKTNEIERPDDHLVEIRGFKTVVGDPCAEDAGGGVQGKYDIFVANDADPPPTDTGHSGIMTQDDDEIIYTSSGQTINNRVWHSSGEVFFPRPILSTGKVSTLARTSPTANGAGELGLMMYYTYREFDEQTVVQQLLNRE